MKKLGQAAIAVSPGTLIYTVPTGYIADVRDMVISNTTAAPIGLTLSMVDSGGAMSSSNWLFPNVSIQGNRTVTLTGFQTMNQGDFIKAYGSAAGLNVRITGEEKRLGT